MVIILLLFFGEFCVRRRVNFLWILANHNGAILLPLILKHTQAKYFIYYSLLLGLKSQQHHILNFQIATHPVPDFAGVFEHTLQA